MNRKKLVALMMTIVLLFSMVIMPDVAFAKKDFTGSKAAFKVGSTTYKIGTTSKTWKSKLGKYTRRENESFVDGMQSFTYTFSGKGVKIETTLRTKTKKETVVSIVITGKTVKTSGGFKVGSTLDEMVDLYGSGYRKSNSTTYTYTAGGRMMAVKFTNDKVKSITMLML